MIDPARHHADGGGRNHAGDDGRRQAHVDRHCQNPPEDLTKLIRLQDASRHLPRNPDGRRINYSTLWRWARYGCRGVHLATWVVGGRRYTTLAALLRFVAERSGDTSASRTPYQEPGEESVVGRPDSGRPIYGRQARRFLAESGFRITG